MEKSTCTRPKPGMSFRPSVPWRIVEGAENAAGFRLLPPGAVGSEIQKGCPVTRSGRVVTYPPGSGEVPRTNALKGNPVRATTTPSTNQSRVRREASPVAPVAGKAYVTAPEKLCLTSKSEDA